MCIDFTLTLMTGQYLLSTVEGALEDVLSLGVLSHQASKGANSPARSLRLEILDLYQALLPEAVSLTDAFGFSDWELDRFVPYPLWRAGKTDVPFKRTWCV